jgi:hypothetical protein
MEKLMMENNKQDINEIIEETIEHINDAVNSFALLKEMNNDEQLKEIIEETEGTIDLFADQINFIYNVINKEE